jgi:uncharacterized damage-inducible protein DinB
MRWFISEGDAPNRLDTILFETLDETPRRARGRRPADRRFRRGLDDRRIAGTIEYRHVSSPEEFEQQLGPPLAHWFNHQTHHRGQIHALLASLVGKAPEPDPLIFQRLSAKPAA